MLEQLVSQLAICKAYLMEKHGGQIHMKHIEQWPEMLH